MDPRLLRYYNRELQFIREMGAEFATEFPKIAGRLGLEGLECADPYVERLLEGFAFLAARVQLKIDAEFPRFTQHLFEAVFPGYLSQTPSMAVVQLAPDLAEGALADGFPLPRGSVLRSLLGKDERTACEYRTAHAVTLWPLELYGAEYLPTTAALAALGLPAVARGRSAIRLRLRSTAGLGFHEIALDRLVLYVRGTEELPTHIYEQMLGNSVGVLACASQDRSWFERLPASAVRRAGFTDEEALLPVTARGFQGYRLLHEYFAFPERFMFVEITGLRDAVRRCEGGELDVFVMLDHSDPVLENVLSESNFALHCTPAVNLFPKRADRIHLDTHHHEYHVVADRTRPMDFEVYDVLRVTGHGAGNEVERSFQRLYAASDMGAGGEDPAFFTLHRERRVLSAAQQLRGPRSSYVGSEVFVALVDASEAPYSSELRQLSLDTLCTNRDLPLFMAVGRGNTDFTLESGAPVQTVRCLSGPTKPRPSWAEGDTTWRLISHLSLNYLSITDSAEPEGAAGLRELLMLYSDVSEATARRQIEGIKSVRTVPITRRMPGPGPISFGRGLEVTVTCDEGAFHGASLFLLGAVLEEFFARYVSINSFTETVVRAVDRGEIKRWPARIGTRHTL